MRLATFIRANIEPILIEWETFARAIWPGPTADPAELRDHAQIMLHLAASNMGARQSTLQQHGKSVGKNDGPGFAPLHHASALHGVDRKLSGFPITAVMAEFRALRASVLRLWRESNPAPHAHDLDDITRFNEYIDQSLAGSVEAFTRTLDQERRAAADIQTNHASEIREMNAALLVSSVHQHELVQDAVDAQARAFQSEQRYRDLVDLGPIAMYSTDAAGVIQDFNHRAAELWGRTPAVGDTEERFCGSLKMFRPDGSHVPHEHCPLADVLKGAVPFVKEAEVHIERPDGSRLIVVVTIRPLKNQQDEITGAINYFYDITDRKRAEEELRKAKLEAEAATRAKDRFLAVLSHELRTPLTPVLMTSTAMETDTDLPHGQRDDMRMIRRNVELEIRLIDDLLDVSRITNGKLRLTFVRLDINELIRAVCRICRKTIDDKGIHLHCEPGQNVREISGDAQRLQQVLWNLLNNAAKFTPAGGDIFISSEQSTDRQVRIVVRDTGKGISPDALERIFNAFEQGEGDITRQFGGLGLGLAISQMLVQRHQGAIYAQSEGPGQGATFIVELPTLAPSAVDPAVTRPPADQKTRVQALRLLVVEDHADTAAVLTKLLSKWGHTVTHAATAAEALAHARTHAFDIVLSDLGLPDMSGYDLMQQLKAQYNFKGIAMSGYGMEEDMRRSAQAGFTEHIVKPMHPDQLAQSIERVSHA